MSNWAEDAERREREWMREKEARGREVALEARVAALEARCADLQATMQVVLDLCEEFGRRTDHWRDGATSAPPEPPGAFG